MKSKSITGKTADDIKARLLESASDGFAPTLAIVFLTPKEQVDGVRAVLSENDIQIFGATVTDEFTEDGVESEAIAVLLLDMHSDYFKIYCLDINENNAEETARQIATDAVDTFSNPAFIVSGSHVTSPGHAILAGLVDVVGPDTTIIGGLASNDVLDEGGIIFTNTHSSTTSMICLVIDQTKVALSGVAVSGWKPMGTLKTITKSEGNRVYTIDNEPALDLLVKYTGIEVDLNDKSDIFTQIGSTIPLQVQKEHGSPVMNPPMMFNAHDRSIVFGMIIEQGSQVRFSLPPDFEVIDNVIESGKKIRDDVPDADAMIIFSCIGRLNAFGPMMKTENNGLQELWNVPMAGFFSFGEFGKTPGGKPEFHGTTCSWVVLKEK